MTLNHSAVDVFFHMTNHYRKLKRVKSAIDHSLPKGYRSRPRNNRSKATKDTSPVNTGQKPKSLERSPCYRCSSRVTRKYSHGGDNEVKTSSGSAVRSVSLPPRPSTRRNPKDMPHASLEQAVLNVSSMGPKMKPIAQQKNSSNVSINPIVQEENYAISKSSPSTNKKSSTDYAHRNTEPALPVPSVLIGSYSSLKRCKMPSEGVQPQLIKETSSSVPEHEYLQFALRITEDIIRNDLYSNEEMRRVFNSHIEANRGRLDADKMNKQIEHLCAELNIPLRASKDFGALTRAQINRLRQTVQTSEPGWLSQENRTRQTEPFVVSTDTNIIEHKSKCADVETNQIVSDQKSDDAKTNALEPLTENTEPASSHDTLRAALNSNKKSETSISDFDQPVMLPGLDDRELSSKSMNGFLINVGIQTSRTNLSNKSEQASKTNVTNKSERTSEHSSKTVNESSGSETKIFCNISSGVFPNKDKKTPKDDASDTSSKHSASIRIIGQNNIEEEFILVPGPIYVPKSAISCCRDTNNCTPTYSQVHDNAENSVHYPSFANAAKKRDLSNRAITESTINRCFDSCDIQPKIVQHLGDFKLPNQSECQLNDVDLTPQREQREDASADNSVKSFKNRSLSQHQCVTCTEEQVYENDLIHSVPDRDVPSTKLLFGDDYLKPPIEPYNITMTPAIAEYFPTVATQTSSVCLLLNECYEVKNHEVQNSTTQQNPEVENSIVEDCEKEKTEEEPEHKGPPPKKTLSFGHDVDENLSVQSSIDQPDTYSEDLITFSALQDGELQKSLLSFSYNKPSEKYTENTDPQFDEISDQIVEEHPKKTDLLSELDREPSLTESHSIENNIMKVTTDWQRFRQVEDNPMLVERQSSLKDLAEIMEKNFEKEEAQSQKLIDFLTEPSEMSAMNEAMSNMNEQPSEDNHVGCCGMMKRNKKRDKKDSNDDSMPHLEEKFSSTTVGSVSHAKSIRFEETASDNMRSSKSDQRIPNDPNRSMSVSKDYELQVQIREFSEALLKQRTSIAGVPERFSYSSYTSDPSSKHLMNNEDDSETSMKTPNSTVSMEDSVSVIRIKKLTNSMEK